MEPRNAAPAQNTVEKHHGGGGHDDEIVPDWQQPMPEERRCSDFCGLMCIPACGGIWNVEQDGLQYVDSKEGHMPYISEFTAALYALTATVLTMFVTVVELVSSRMDNDKETATDYTGEVDAAAISKTVLQEFMWGYVMLYPLAIMSIIAIICLETMSREYLFYAYLRNGIILDLQDTHSDIFSLAYWNPRTASIGLFPHVCIVFTVVLGLVTRAKSSTLIIVCIQCVTLLLFFNNILALKSRLVSVSEFVHATVERRTAATQAAVDEINKQRFELSKHSFDVDGDGKADLTCFYGIEDTVLDAARHSSPEMLALDAKHQEALETHRAAVGAAMREVSAILAKMECVTEADVRADFRSISAEKAHLGAALKKNKIAKEEHEARAAKLRYCFGELDPVTGQRLPTLGLIGRKPLAHKAGFITINVVLALFCCGAVLPNRLWALDIINQHKKTYAGLAASTHARFGKRLVIMSMFMMMLMLCVEAYGLVKGGEAFANAGMCESQTIAMCQSDACLKDVCTEDVMDVIVGRHRR